MIDLKSEKRLMAIAALIGVPTGIAVGIALATLAIPILYPWSMEMSARYGVLPDFAAGAALSAQAVAGCFIMTRRFGKARRGKSKSQETCA